MMKKVAVVKKRCCGLTFESDYEIVVISVRIWS